MIMTMAIPMYREVAVAMLMDRRIARAMPVVREVAVAMSMDRTIARAMPVVREVAVCLVFVFLTMIAVGYPMPSVVKTDVSVFQD